jgi:hypothetical protein
MTDAALFRTSSYKRQIIFHSHCSGLLSCVMKEITKAIVVVRQTELLLSTLLLLLRVITAKTT